MQYAVNHFVRLAAKLSVGAFPELHHLADAKLALRIRQRKWDEEAAVDADRCAASAGDSMPPAMAGVVVKTTANVTAETLHFAVPSCAATPAEAHPASVGRAGVLGVRPGLEP